MPTAPSSPSRRLPLGAALWFLAAPLAAWATVELQACPAPAALAVPLAVLAAVALGLGTLWDGAHPRRAALALIAGLAAASLLPLSFVLTTPAVPDAHDLSLHLWALWGTARSLAGGDPWPRMDPHLGLGQPVLGFYPPLTHWLGAPAILGGLAPTQAAKWLGWLSGVAAASGAWGVLRDRGAGRAAAALGATALLLAPYRLLDLNYRFALGELFGLALALPLVHFGHRVVTGAPGAWVRRPRAALWIVATLLAFTHPISGILAAWAGVAVLGHAAHRRRAGLARGVAVALGIGALSFATAGAYLVPAALEGEGMRIGQQLPSGPGTYSSKALHPGQTLQRERWNGRRLSFTLKAEAARRARGESVREVPFYLGLGLAFAVLGGLGGAARPRRRAAEGSGPAPDLSPLSEARVAWALAAVLAWASTLPALAWLMGHLSVFHPLQFPWRFLGPASALAAGCLGLLFDGWIRAAGPRIGAVLVACAVGLLAWEGGPGYGAGAVLDARPDLPLTREAVRVGVPQPGCRADAQGVPTQAVALTLPDPLPGGPRGDVPVPVWGLKLPPNRLDVPVSRAWRGFPELVGEGLHRDLVRPARKGDAAAMRELGVRLRVRPGGVRQIDGAAFVRVRTAEGTRPLAARVTRSGDGYRLDLPEGTSGDVILGLQWLPGWRARVDAGAWAVPEQVSGLLAVPAAGATTLEVAYRGRPGARRVGALLSLLGLGLGLGLARREGEGAS